MISIGLVGLGNMGANHSRILSSLPNVNFLGYHDVSERIDFGQFHFFQNYDELLAFSDAVVISSPTNLHLQHSVRAAEMGVASLVEKPLATDYGSGSLIAQAVNKHKTLAAIGMVERFNPAAAAAKKTLRNGSIGKALVVSTLREGPFPARVGDVGVGLDLAIHDLDLVEWMTGEKIISLTSEKVPAEKSGHEDYFLGQMTTEKGTKIQLNANWRSPRKTRLLRIYGTDGVLEVDLLQMTIRIDKNSDKAVLWEQKRNLFGDAVGDSEILGLEKEEPLLLELTRFAQFVCGDDRGELADVNSGLELLKLLETSKTQEP